MRKFGRITNGQENGVVDSKREIRNLLLVGLSIALLLTLWFRFQQNRFRFQQNRVTNFALSHLHGNATAPQSDGTYPCVFASLSEDDVPTPALSRCAVPTTPTASVDRFEVDLRYGAFVLRQTDLQLRDVSMFRLRGYTIPRTGACIATMCMRSEETVIIRTISRQWGPGIHTLR